MIVKTTSGGDFSGCSKYLIDDKKQSEVLLQKNCFSSDPTQLAEQMQNISDCNKRCTKPVIHHSLSFPTEDKITVEKMTEIAEEFAEQSGYEQYSIIKHNDTEHKHVHIVANRVRMDGTTVTNQDSKIKAKNLAQKLEIKHKLTIAKNQEVKKINSKNLNKKEEREQIYKTSAEYINNSKNVSFKGYLENMQSKGIEVIVAKSGDKINGMSFKIEGSKLKHKGSQVHSNLKWNKFKEIVTNVINKQEKVKINNTETKGIRR